MKPYEECTQFESCSCNRCPLDPEMLSMAAQPGEEQCRALRRGRVAIAERYPELPTHGLTEREMKRDRRSALAKARWNALDPAERELRTSRLTQARAVLSGSGKAGGPG